MSRTEVAADAVARDLARAPGKPSLLRRIYASWEAYQTRVARSYVVPHLKHIPDAELLKRGYTAEDIRELRAEKDSAPQHWV